MKHPLSAYTFLAGCSLATSALLIAGIYKETNGNPCEDCSYREQNCRLFNWMKKNPAKVIKPEALNLKTNKELADIHGITKRQVAKRRVPGTDQLLPATE